MSKVKNLTRAVAFLLVFGLLFVRIQQLVTPNWDWPDYGERMNKAITGLYREDKESVDVFWLGTSHMQYGVSPMQVYRLSGIRSYNLATAGQPLLLSYYRLKSALKQQSPKVVVLDASACFYTDRSNRGYKRWLKAVSCFHLDRLAERIEIASAMPLLDMEGDKLTQTVSAVLPIIQFHSGYMLNEKAFTNLHLDKVYPQKGYVISTRIKAATDSGAVGDADMDADAVEEEEVDATDANLVEKLSKRLEGNREQLERIVKLCQDNGCELIMTKMPVYETPSAFSGDWPKEKHDVMQRWCDEKGIKLVDLNTIDIGIDWEMDSCDGGGHMNKLGAVKVSDYLASWLTQNYGFERQANRTERWDKVLGIYDTEMKYFDLQMVSDLMYYMDRLRAGNYTVLCAVSGPAGEYWSEEVQGRFAELMGEDVTDLCQLWRDAPNTAYAAVASSSAPLEQAQRKDSCSLDGALPGGALYSITSTGVSGTKAASVVIDGKEYAVSGKGVCFVVYDNDMGCVVDSVLFNTKQEGCPAKHDNGFVSRFRVSLMDYENRLIENM